MCQWWWWWWWVGGFLCDYGTPIWHCLRVLANTGQTVSMYEIMTALMNTALRQNLQKRRSSCSCPTGKAVSQKCSTHW